MTEIFQHNDSVNVEQGTTQAPNYEQFIRAYEPLGITADFKTNPEDFVVEELLSFSLSGEGEHVWLYIRKRGCNTNWVADLLAKFAGLKQRAVGYAGLKDRHGVTSQWFSVHLPGMEEPDWSLLESEEISILKNVRHSRKLQRGALKENHFHITLRNVTGPVSALSTRCELIAQQGVPNYFGEQRFGHSLANLAHSESMFLKPEKRISRHKRSLYLSAARSWLFNEILATRILNKTWNRRIAGDVFMLDGKSACFSDDGSDDLDTRIDQLEIHPTAVLWGSGHSMSQAECADLEKSIIDQWPIFRDGLVKAKVQQQRRALRVLSRDMEWSAEGDSFSLAFKLRSGSYATMVLRELVQLNEPKRANIPVEIPGENTGKTTANELI